MWTHGVNTVKDIYQPFIYADGHKINLDLGTPTTKVAALFDLDTFTWKIFAAAQSEDA